MNYILKVYTLCVYIYIYDMPGDIIQATFMISFSTIKKIQGIKRWSEKKMCLERVKKSFCDKIKGKFMMRIKLNCINILLKIRTILKYTSCFVSYSTSKK